MHSIDPNIVVPEFFQMVLVADKSEVSPKSHDEILDIVNNRVFYDPFVNILLVTYTQLLDIDKIEQVLVLEHANRLQGVPCILHGGRKIVGKIALMLEQVRFEHIAEFVFVPTIDE